MKVPGKQCRDAQMTTSGQVDLEARTAALAFSSETPYRRWFGDEILDHTRSCVRLDRMRSGAPVLMGHDQRDQVGVVEFVNLGSDRVGRAVIRFSRSKRGEEALQDVADGIITKVSVGYLVHDLHLEKEEAGVCTYRVTDWEPLEISLVAVPADNSVGIGRNLSTTTLQGNPMDQMSRRERRALAHGDEPHTDTTKSAEFIELQRRERILAGAQAFEDQGGYQVAARLISDPAATVADFRREMLESLRGKQRPTATGEPYDMKPEYGAGAREVLEKSTCFGGPDAERRAYASGMWLKGLYGDDKAATWCRQNGLEIRAMSAMVNAAGGVLVPSELSSAIIDLSETYGIFRKESDTWPMGSDTLTIPRSTSDPSTVFVGESDAISDSQGGWDAVTLSAKKIATIIKIPTELIEDSVINIADRVAFQLGRAFAKKEDECGFLGDGTSTYGGMRGIFTLIADGSHNGGKVTAAANNDTFPEITATDLANLVAALPEYAHDGAKFYCSQVAWSSVFFRLLAGLAGNSASDVTGKIAKSYGGYPVVTSAVLPAGVSTDYTALTMIAFGNLRLASSFGSRRDMRIQILTETYANYDQIGILGTERFDIVNHDLGNNSVAGPIVGLVGA